MTVIIKPIDNSELLREYHNYYRKFENVDIIYDESYPLIKIINKNNHVM